MLPVIHRQLSSHRVLPPNSSSSNANGVSVPRPQSLAAPVELLSFFRLPVFPERCRYVVSAAAWVLRQPMTLGATASSQWDTSTVQDACRQLHKHCAIGHPILPTAASLFKIYFNLLMYPFVAALFVFRRLSGSRCYSSRRSARACHESLMKRQVPYWRILALTCP